MGRSVLRALWALRGSGLGKACVQVEVHAGITVVAYFFVVCKYFSVAMARNLPLSEAFDHFEK